MIKPVKLTADGPRSIWRGFSALRKRQLILPFAGFFVMYLLYGLLLSGSVSSALSTGAVATNTIFALSGFLAITIISAFLGGLIIYYYASKNQSLWSGISYVTKRFPTLFVVVLSTGVLTILGFVALIVPGIFFSVKFMFAQQEVMIRDKGVVESIKSSYRSSKGRFWPQFSLIFVVAALSIMAYAISRLFFDAGPFQAYLSSASILPVDAIISLILAYVAVFGSAAVTDYFLRRGI